jgi:hypothetical protein
MSKRKHGRIEGQFAPRLIEMLESPAYRALSFSGRRVLDVIEIELAQHAGKDNGKLPVTFRDFVAYGLHWNGIAPAIRETVSLGFVKVTRPGRAGNGASRIPNLFRLTYRHSDREEPTHDWRRITTMEQARKLAGRTRPKNKTPLTENVSHLIRIPYLTPLTENVSLSEIRNPYHYLYLGVGTSRAGVCLLSLREGSGPRWWAEAVRRLRSSGTTIAATVFCGAEVRATRRGGAATSSMIISSESLPALRPRSLRWWKRRSGVMGPPLLGAANGRAPPTWPWACSSIRVAGPAAWERPARA